MRARQKAFLALKDLIVTAPDELRAELCGIYRKTLVHTCRTLVVPEMPCTPTDATKIALKSLAVRCHELDTETARLTQQIDTLTSAAAPELRAVYGVGPDCAATLLAAVGDNPHRLRSDAAFAKLCGVSPVEASSGKVVRHRLNRGGNRDANRALHTILIVRMRRHQPTRDYLGKTPGRRQNQKAAMRCLKRYIAREIFHALRPAQQPAKTVA